MGKPFTHGLLALPHLLEACGRNFFSVEISFFNSKPPPRVFHCKCYYLILRLLLRKGSLQTYRTWFTIRTSALVCCKTSSANVLEVNGFGGAFLAASFSSFFFSFCPGFGLRRLALFFPLQIPWASTWLSLTPDWHC